MSSPLTGKKVAFLGCGSMATAIAGGAVKSGAVSAACLGLSNRTAAKADALAATLGGAVSHGSDNAKAGIAVTLTLT